MAVNLETQGIVLWSRITEAGIKNDPSQYSTHDTKSVQLATTQARVEEFIQEIANQVLPEFYANVGSLTVTKTDLDRISKEVSEILKDPDPERIHKSMLAIQHLPTLAEERPVTQKGTPSAASVVAEEWDSLPFIIKSTAPAYEKDKVTQQVVPGTFRPLPCDIYVDQALKDNFLSQLKPSVKVDEWARMKDVFHDADAWLEENLWGWRVIQLTGFKVSKGAAGLKLGFYPNKLSFHSKVKDYPAQTAAGPVGGGRQDDDL